MSIQATNWVWNNSSHKGGPLLVLLAIADHAHDDGGGAYPSIDTLAFKSRLSTRQVKRVLHELVESGELVIEPNAGPRGANLYTVTFERGEEKEEAGGDKMSPLAGPASDDDAGGDKMSPLTGPAGGEEAEGDIPGKVGPEFDPEKGNIQSCDSDFSTALILQLQKCGEEFLAASVMAAPGRCLAPPSPPGPPQH